MINEVGELLEFCFTPGNTDDRKPVEKIAKQLTGKLFSDRGYISKQLFEDLLQQSLQIIPPCAKK